MKYPFTEKIINENIKVRKFLKNVDPQSLIWHRDYCDRLIEVIKSNGWSIQKDNEMPQKLTEGLQIFIEAGEYHRVIKGDGDLVIKIHEKKKKGLWDNIRAKKARGEKSNPRTKSYQDAKKAGQKINRNESDSIQEAEPESTIKYNSDPALTKGQRKLPDVLQKGIIDKADKEKKSSKKESIVISSSELRKVIRETLHEELSKKTKATLRKKAEERGLTAGSVEKEYKKGLAAWATSGSRKGMGQHQWAMARVNSATPSKSWAVVKKSKAKKK
jgi:hypothetical protein